MAKSKKDNPTQWNRSVKIPDYQEKKIEELQKKLGPSVYRSVSDFVVKAVENEIRLATFKAGLSEMGRYHFDLKYSTKLMEAMESTYEFDKGTSGVTFPKKP